MDDFDSMLQITLEFSLKVFFFSPPEFLFS